MKAWDLAEQFRIVFAADAAFAGINPRTGQDATDIARPALIFSCQTRPIDAHGRALAFQLSVIVESQAFDAEGDAAADVAHAGWLSAVQRKFFGTAAADLATAKAAMATAIAAGGKFELRGYDAPPMDDDPGIEKHRFRSALVIAGIALVVGNV